MIPSHRTATHPGAILLEEYIAPMGLTQRAVAAHLGVPVQRINEIVAGSAAYRPKRRGFFEAFQTSPEFWLNLQNAYELSSRRPSGHVTPIAPAGTG